MLQCFGHRRIAVLSGPAVLSVVVERIAGYRRALAEAGQDLDDSLIFYSAFSQDAGHEMVQQALTLTPHPTAMFALNNFISIGAIRGIRDAGFRVPEDVAVVGFDDLPRNLVIDPFLTAAVQPAYEMGK
jgi:DNA-binding LacI/PurR family transcriptional regulator